MLTVADILLRMAESVKLLPEQLGAHGLVVGVKRPRGKVGVELVDHLPFKNYGLPRQQFPCRFLQVKLHVVCRM